MSGIRHNIAFKNFRSWKYWTICPRALDTHTHTHTHTHITHRRNREFSSQTRTTTASLKFF